MLNGHWIFPARVAAALSLFIAGHLAWGAADAPRLQHLEGSAAVAPRGDTEWTDARAGRPMRAGDRLWTDPGARVEIVRTGHALRFAGTGHLTLDRADTGRTQWSLRQGTVIARVAALAPGDDIEIDTPHLALRPTLPGLYRLDVDREGGTTRVQVLEGAGIAYGEQGQSVPLAVGQHLFRGRNLTASAPAPVAAPDGFAQWAQARDHRAAAAATAALGAGRAEVQATRPAPDARQAQADARKARQQAQRRREREREQAHLAWVRQQRALAERWRREQEDWLRYQHGLPPVQPGIPVRRVG